DLELWMRTCHTSQFGRLQVPLFFYRESLAGNLKNYLATAKTVRKIVAQYGPAAVGRIGTAALIARSHLKGASYRTLTRLGWQSRLIRNRNRPLNSQESREGETALRIVLETNVPGFVGSTPQPLALESRL